MRRVYDTVNREMDVSINFGTRRGICPALFQRNYPNYNSGVFRSIILSINFAKRELLRAGRFRGHCLRSAFKRELTEFRTLVSISK